MLKIRALRKRQGDFVLDIPELSVTPGTFTVLAGDNGAGKTTLIRCITNFIRDYKGEIYVGGTRYTGFQKEVTARLGYMSEEMSLIEELTAAGHFTLAQALSGRWNQTICDRLTDQLNLDARKPVRELSRGNRVKLGLIVALSREPDLLIFDEPTSGLDPVSREIVLSELKRKKGSRTVSALISTHLLQEAEVIADEIAVMRAGKIIARLPGDIPGVSAGQGVLELLKQKGEDDCSRS